jgi:hypothetical protein
MRFIEDLCPPALLYMIYIVIQVALDFSLGYYWMATSKVFCGFIGVLLLDAFCTVDLGILSWVIIATPFMMTAFATSLAMGLQLDRTMTKFAVEKFTPMTADDKKNRDLYVTTLRGGEAPVSSNPF